MDYSPRPKTFEPYGLNEKGNLIIRNRRLLITTNEKFIVKNDYESIIEPSETTSRDTIAQLRTDIPSNIVPSSARTKSGRIIRK